MSLIGNKFKKLFCFIRGKINFFLKSYIQYPPYEIRKYNYLLTTDDPIRYISIALAINRIKKKKIEGNFAELGVYKGFTSKIIHSLAPEKTIYLFDTFQGFPVKQLDKKDERFKDTTLEILKNVIGDLNNIVIRKGLFPETAEGLEDEAFSFIMIDLDIYEPTMSALEFFYPRIKSGGYIFIHDYNNLYESKGAVYRAVNKFMKDKPEKIIEIPDKWGSVIIRKI